jgi:hypothetical protein
MVHAIGFGYAACSACDVIPEVLLFRLLLFRPPFALTASFGSNFPHTMPLFRPCYILCSFFIRHLFR